MAEIVRIGMAGCGSVAQRGLIPHLVQEDIGDRTILQAVMDPVENRAKDTAAKFGVPSWYESYEDLLADDQVDAIVIASPIGYHYEQGLQAIAAGKHIHFNKTMTTTTAEATEVIDAAAEAGLTLVASPGQMQRPIMRRAKEIIDEGDLGRLYFASVGMGFRGHEWEPIREGEDSLTRINPLWYYRKQAGGGPMYDAVVYRLHSLTGILGPALRVMGMSGTGVRQREYKGETVDVDVHDNTHLLLDFGDDIFADVWGVFASPPRRPGLQFSGAEASLDINGTNLVVHGGRLNGTQEAEFPQLPFVIGPHVEIPESHVFSDIMHLVECVRTGYPPQVTAQHARHVIEIIEAGYRSAETGQAQELATTF